MTEQEWLTSTDPQRMLAAFRLNPPNIKPSDRKLRLFACGCCRQVWHLLDDDVPCWGHGAPANHAGCLICSGTGRINRSRRAVEVAERYADGQATGEELHAAEEYGREAWIGVGRVPFSPEDAVGSCTGLPRGDTHLIADHILPFSVQAALLCCIFGNPFRPVHWSDLQVRSWNNCTVPRLARAIYDERAFDRLPILADALEEAGCDNADLLTHLRGPGLHARGCWVLDLLLGWPSFS